MSDGIFRYNDSVGMSRDMYDYLTDNVIQLRKLQAAADVPTKVHDRATAREVVNFISKALDQIEDDSFWLGQAVELDLLYSRVQGRLEAEARLATNDFGAPMPIRWMTNRDTASIERELNERANGPVNESDDEDESKPPRPPRWMTRRD
jgi:hypothetical protein